MNRLVANFRYLAWVAVFGSFVSALCMMIAGVIKVGKTLWIYGTGKSNMVSVASSLQPAPKLTPVDNLTVMVIESLDTFLFAGVLIYFGYGMYAIFCAREDDRLVKNLPQAIVPSSLGELKQTLGQIILVVLMVLFTRQMWLEHDNLHWEDIIIPAGVLLLAGGLRLSGVGKH